MKKPKKLNTTPWVATMLLSWLTVIGTAGEMDNAPTTTWHIVKALAALLLMAASVRRLYRIQKDQERAEIRELRRQERAQLKEVA